MLKYKTFALLIIAVTHAASHIKPGVGSSKHGRFRDCQDVRDAGNLKSGVYHIHLNDTFKVEVYCDHQLNKSYTIIQQRMYGNENFQRGISDYQLGFGSASGDYWIGLVTIHHLTQLKNTVLDIQLQDWSGNNRGGTYKYFAVSDANDRYRLQIAGFTGNVVDDLSYSNNMQFSTYDAPDYYKCAVNQKAGWWYNYCAYAMLNGLYYSGGPYTPHGGFYDGIYWKDWMGYGYSLRFTRMMLSKP